MTYFLDSLRRGATTKPSIDLDKNATLRDMIAMSVAPDVKQIWESADKSEDGSVSPSAFAAESALVASACYIFADAMINAGLKKVDS